MNVRSKIRVCLLTALILAGSCNRGGENETLQNEAAIRNASNAYMDAFNHQDSDALSLLWTDDAVFVNFTRRETIEGRDEIAAYFTDQFQHDNDSRLKITIESIDFKGAGKAIEKGTASISHKTDPIQQIVYQAEYVKIDNSWLLQKITEIALEQSPSNFEHLKELNWLVGSWIDADVDDTVDFKSTYRWDRNTQVDAINCMIGIIDEPYTGDDYADYNLRRNKIDAARVLLSLKTRMLKRSGGSREPRI